MSMTFTTCRSVAINLLLCLLCAAFPMFMTEQAQAASYTWNVATGNWSVAGNWTPTGGPPGTAPGDTGAINSGTATANVQLPNSPTITVGGTGILSINALPTSATGGTVTVNNRLEYVGVTTGSTNISMQNNSTFGKGLLNAVTSTLDNLSITGTVTANNIQATGNASSQGLQFLGGLSGSGTLVIDSSGVGNRHGALTLAPVSANSFNGTVNVSGFGGVLGTLALGGTGALRNVTALNLSSGADLKLINTTDPLPINSTITVPNGGRIDWVGTQTYTTLADRPAIVLNHGASIGRNNETLGVGSISSETSANCAWRMRPIHCRPDLSSM